VDDLKKEGSEAEYYMPAIRIVSEIFYLNDSYLIQALLNLNVIKAIKCLLTNITDSDVLKQLLFTVSNMAASNELCIGELISNGIITIVVQKLKEEEYKIRIECIYIISNIFQTASMAQIKHCLEMGALDTVLMHLKPEMSDAVGIIIDGISSLLKRWSISGELSDIKAKILSIDEALNLCEFADLNNGDSVRKAKGLLEEYYGSYTLIKNKM
jgi:hypothetical protein